MLTPRTTSWKRTVPVSSVRMKVLKGSHSAKAWRDLTSWPSADEDPGAVGHLVVLDLAAAVVEDGDVGVPVDDDERPFPVLDGLEVVELEDAVVLGLDLGPLGAAHGDAADVEGPHRQLRAGLADGLGGDDAAGLAELDHLAGGRRAAVAELADAPLGLAGQDRADLDPLDAQVLELLGDLLGDLRVHVDDRLARVGVDDLLEGDPADDPVDEGLDDLAVLDDGRDVDALERAAVVLVDDDLLADVDELAGQVAGIGRLEGRVGQALAGAVGRDEVLEDVQALPEVGGDRASPGSRPRASTSGRASRPAGGSAACCRGSRSRT